MKRGSDFHRPVLIIFLAILKILFWLPQIASRAPVLRTPLSRAQSFESTKISLIIVIKGINSSSIYTRGHLGDLSNLIGSLSRTIQQYSPPSEWIMCELGVFPIFSREQERSFKSGKRLWSIQNGVFPFTVAEFWARWTVYSFRLFSEEEAVSFTQLFLTRKIWPTNRSLFMKNKFESNCLQKFDANSTGRRRLTSSNRAASFVSIPCKERNNKHFWL